MDTQTQSTTIKLWLAMLALAALALTINVPPYVPLQDYNEWVYQGYIGSQLLDRHLTDQFAFVVFPVPNSLVQAAFCALNFFLQPSACGRVIANLYVVLAAILGWKLSKRMSGSNNSGYFLTLLICIYFNSPFWDGYVNYQFGILLLSAYLLLSREKRALPTYVLVFSVTAFFTHAVIWATLLLLMLIEAIRTRRYKNYSPAIISVAMFIWYAACRPQISVPDGFSRAGFLHNIAYKLYTLAKMGPYHNFVFQNGGDASAIPLAYLVGVIVNVLAAIMVIWVVFEAIVKVKRDRVLPTEMTVGLILFILFFAFPSVLSGVVNPGERLLYPALILILFNLHESKAIKWLSYSIIVLIFSAFNLLTTNPALWSEETRPDLLTLKVSRILFWSRPTQFAYNIKILNGQADPKPLEFETSFMINKDLPATGLVK